MRGKDCARLGTNKNNALRQRKSPNHPTTPQSQLLPPKAESTFSKPPILEHCPRCPKNTMLQQEVPQHTMAPAQLHLHRPTSQHNRNSNPNTRTKQEGIQSMGRTHKQRMVRTMECSRVITTRIRRDITRQNRRWGICLRSSSSRIMVCLYFL